MQVSVLHQAKNILGEGPLWHHLEQALYWVDIEKKKIYRLDWHSKKCEFFHTPTRPGALAIKKEGGVYVALERGIAVLNTQTKEFQEGVAPLSDRDDVRFNDGKCDRKGRFWCGSLELTEENPEGALFRFDDFQTATKMDEGFTVSNGLGWSPDNKTFYFTDSPRRQIFQYDYQLETGEIKNRRDFISFSPEDGYPDGLCVDSEGYLWVCHWDGWKVTRFTPKGEVDTVIAMPVQCPTCCTFGGPDLNQLFITSARRDLSQDDLAKSPDSGAIFVVDVGVTGVEETPASF